MEMINFITTESGKVSIQASCPEVNGIVQPMEMYIVIEDIKGKYKVYNFNREQCKELMMQFKRANNLVKCFG